MKTAFNIPRMFSDNKFSFPTKASPNGKEHLKELLKIYFA